jgi:hypothetical protein
MRSSQNRLIPQPNNQLTRAGVEFQFRSPTRASREPQIQGSAPTYVTVEAHDVAI